MTFDRRKQEMEYLSLCDYSFTCTNCKTNLIPIRKKRLHYLKQLKFYWLNKSIVDRLHILDSLKCPRCKSTKKTKGYNFSDTYDHEILEFIGIKEISPEKQKQRGKTKQRDLKAPIREYTDGVSFVKDKTKHKEFGTYIYRTTLIDKENDIYHEICKTITGKIIHECKEPLSAHRNHGSAKIKK